MNKFHQLVDLTLASLCTLFMAMYCWTVLVSLRVLRGTGFWHITQTLLIVLVPIIALLVMIFALLGGFTNFPR